MCSTFRRLTVLVLIIPRALVSRAHLSVLIFPVLNLPAPALFVVSA